MEKKLIVKINGVDVEVHFKDVYTRKIDKEYNSILFKGVDFGLDGNNIKANPDNFQDANDYLITAMTDLDLEKIMDLSVNDYNEILRIVSEIKNPLLKKENLLSNSEKPWGQIEE